MLCISETSRYISPKAIRYQVAFCRWTGLSSVHHELHLLKVTCCRSKCCVQSGLDFEATGSSVGHYMLQGNCGAINTTWVPSWLNVEALERALTPLFRRPVWCSVHGHSFVRLQYIACTCQLIIDIWLSFH